MQAEEYTLTVTIEGGGGFVSDLVFIHKTSTENENSVSVFTFHHPTLQFRYDLNFRQTATKSTIIMWQNIVCGLHLLMWNTFTGKSFQTTQIDIMNNV